VTLSLWSDSSESNPQPRTVILSSTFASMSRTVHEHYPWFPFHYLVLDRWPSVDCIKNVKVPITIFHGTEDDFVSLSQARTLAKASPNATLIEIAGSGHNDIPMMQLKTLLRNEAP
jgi:pimeloyl-ACP methyl ester carboxylesterase